MENKIKKIYLVIAISTTVCGFIFKLGYRSYIYKNNINDFGIADSAPNFFYTVGIIFFMLYIQKKIEMKATRNIILATTAGVLTYELEQNFTSMIFDVKDVIATIIGTIICYLICRYLNDRYNLSTAKEVS